MEQLWLTWAKQLQAIASTGVHFSTHPYDTERYEEIANIAQNMLSALGQVPIEKIQTLVADFAKGYATPRIDVRGAVIRDNKILLVQEQSDRLWSLPGGYADVGLSAAENVVKEINEEANLSVKVTNLYCVRHKAKHEYSPDARDFYKLFFLCTQIRDGDPSPGLETRNVGFFEQTDLPPLSKGRVIEKDISAAFLANQEQTGAANFD